MVFLRLSSIDVVLMTKIDWKTFMVFVFQLQCFLTDLLGGSIWFVLILPLPSIGFWWQNVGLSQLDFLF